MVEIIKKNFRRIWFVVLGLAAVVITGRLALQLPAASSPTLQDVLAKPAGGDPDAGALTALLLAFSFAVLSAAKGYEIFRRGQAVAGTVLAEPPIAEQDGEREIEELRRSVEEYKAELVHQRGVEELLRKSNLVFSKEIERLKNDNEELTLKTSKIKLTKVKKSAKKKTDKRTKRKR